MGSFSGFCLRWNLVALWQKLTYCSFCPLEIFDSGLIWFLHLIVLLIIAFEHKCDWLIILILDRMMRAMGASRVQSKFYLKLIHRIIFNEYSIAYFTILRYIFCWCLICLISVVWNVSCVNLNIRRLFSCEWEVNSLLNKKLWTDVGGWNCIQRHFFSGRPPLMYAVVVHVGIRFVFAVKLSLGER